MSRWLGVAAGLCAIASAFAHVAYVLTFRDDAITAWNLLIIPATLALGVGLATRNAILAMACTAAGIAAALMWAPSFRVASAEVWWIGLAALWWLGIGWLMVPRHRITGWLTLVLGVAAAVDLVVTVLDAQQPLLALGGLKIPLSAVWSAWIGVLLIRGLLPESPSSSRRSVASAAAIVGGVVWALGGAGWLLTHGIASNPSAEKLFGLRGTEITQLLVVAGLLWMLALLAGRPMLALGRLARASWITAVLGVGMVTLGAFMETSFVNPDFDFFHPFVQGGWILFITGLFPVACLGILGLGVAGPRGERFAYLLLAACAPLPVVSFFLGELASRSPIATAAFAALHAAPGLGLVLLGRATRMSAVADTGGILVNTPMGY